MGVLVRLLITFWLTRKLSGKTGTLVFSRQSHAAEKANVKQARVRTQEVHARV